MNTRILGKSGFSVSEIGLGCWQLGGDFGPLADDQAHDILAAAEEVAIDFWDTADVYGGGLSEERLSRYLSKSGFRPVVATKVGRTPDLFPDGYTREKVRANIQASARRLGVETVDLIQLHCVPPEVLEAGDILDWLDDFQREGLIRAFGASVETVEQGRIAAQHPGLTSLQIVFNLFRQNAIEHLFPLAVKNDVGIIVRLPLASGVLAGKMRKDQVFAKTDHRNYNRHGEAFSVGETFSGVPFEQAVDFVEEMKAWLPAGMTMAQMAMRWILDFPAVSTIIAGATRPAQVRENASVSALPSLEPEVHQRLSDFYKTRVEPVVQVEI
jgi:aryl-alcohol dehydrogenase-like predicted oxidoreductase